jgi:hypothetical protein
MTAQMCDVQGLPLYEEVRQALPLMPRELCSITVEYARPLLEWWRPDPPRTDMGWPVYAIDGKFNETVRCQAGSSWHTPSALVMGRWTVGEGMTRVAVRIDRKGRGSAFLGVSGLPPGSAPALNRGMSSMDDRDPACEWVSQRAMNPADALVSLTYGWIDASIRADQRLDAQPMPFPGPMDRTGAVYELALERGRDAARRTAQVLVWSATVRKRRPCDERWRWRRPMRCCRVAGHSADTVRTGGRCAGS